MYWWPVIRSHGMGVDVFLGFRNCSFETRDKSCCNLWSSLTGPRLLCRSIAKATIACAHCLTLSRCASHQNEQILYRELKYSSEDMLCIFLFSCKHCQSCCLCYVLLAEDEKACILSLTTMRTMSYRIAWRKELIGAIDDVQKLESEIMMLKTCIVNKHVPSFI